MREFLAGVDRQPVASIETLAGSGGLVVVAPHPDDESIGCGGLIAGAIALRRRVAVVVVTDGSGSHPESRTHPPARLAALRRDEALRATAALGLPGEDVTFLDLKDTAAPSDGPAFEAAVARIAEVVDATDATTLFVTWAFDPHCDHVAAAAMAGAVAQAKPGLRLWHYPVWGLHRPPEEAIDALPRGLRLNVTAWLPRKREAIAAHGSQRGEVITDDPHGFALTPAMLAPFLEPFERFLEPPP